MKKEYSAPDMELYKVLINDVILSSPIEGNIPTEGNLDPTEPGGGGSVIDF